MAAPRKNTTRFMDQGGVEGVRDLPRSRTLDFFDRAHNRGRRGQSRYSRSPCTAWGRSLRDRAGFKRDAFRVIYAVQLADEIWVVHAFPEEVHAGHQDTATRDPLDKGSSQEFEG